MIRNVCVCGAGTMGLGIAQVTAAAGMHTILFDLSDNVLQQARERLQATLNKLVDKGKMNAGEADALLERIVFTSQLLDCKAELIVEAIVEKMEAKVSLFQQLESINSESTILASNTSSLPVTELAGALKHPGRCAGLHFFNPAPLMKLVEVVKANQTSDTVVQQLVAFTKAVGKTPVVCKDSPGFIVNRVARPFYIEALRLLEAGFATPAQIDDLLEARGFRMGPFRLMDLIGNDVNYAVSCSVYEQLGKPERLKPSDIQKEKVTSGMLGKKTGQGYYTY